MLPAEIARATDEGLTVCWQSPSYQVIKGELGSGYFIRSLVTGHCIRLFKSDGKSLNGAESDFFIRGTVEL
jgi:hypothetical protein